MGRKFKDPRKAAFKLWVCFSDGGRVCLSSRDWKGKKHVPDEGLIGLERYVMRKSHLIANAIIYDKRGGRDRVIRKFSSGTWKIYDTIEFT